MKDNTILTTGMAEVSVKEIIALEKSVGDKDQTIGALREQIKGLEAKIIEVKADAAAKQMMVLIQKGGTKTQVKAIRGGYDPWASASNFYTTEEVATPDNKEYRNLDSVIVDIRKEEAEKVGADFAKLEKELQNLNLQKNKLENDLNYKLAEVKETLEKERKDKQKEIKKAVTESQKEVDKILEELCKVKEDKTDAAVEEARKQEIIDLKLRIEELEKGPDVLNLGWFKTKVYNWLNIDGRVKVQAEREHLEKKERVDKISNQYPGSKNWWNPFEGSAGSAGMPWWF